MAGIAAILKENFQAILLVILTVGLIVSMGNQPTINVSPEGKELFDTLSVAGQSEIKVQPDEAEISVGITTEATEADAAESQNTDISNRIIQALKAQGVRDAEIETTYYYLYPKTNWDQDTGRSQIYGYTVSHTLTVKTTKVDIVGQLVDAAVEAGANNVNNIQFQLSEAKRDTEYSKALEAASKDGKVKADAMASALGAKIVNLKSVSEGSVYYNPYPIYRDTMGGAMESAKSPDIMPQELTVSASVSMVYEIE